MNKVIVGTGSYLPQTIVTNHDIEKVVDDYDRARSGIGLHEWAMERVGVDHRHRIAPGEGTSDMAAHASQRALDDAGLKASDIDVIVVSTFTSDYRAPNTAGLLQAALGIQSKFFQIEHACSGFVDATVLASSLMDLMGYKTALVCSSEAVSVYCDPQLFMMQTIFGDGAGAVLLQNSPDPKYGIKAHVVGGDGSIGQWAAVPGNGSKQPPSHELLATRDQYIRLEYKKVYPFAVKTMADMSRQVAAKVGKTPADIDWYVPHQTGRRIIEDTAQDLGEAMDKFIMCIDHTGNTSGATIAIALDEANRAGKFKDGQSIVMTTIGAGMSWGALYLDWYDYKQGR